MNFITWLQNTMSRGLSLGIGRYYSIYRACVMDNKDPDNLGRVKILCPQVGQTLPPDVWVLPAMMGAGNQRGMFFVPEKGDTVFVSFFEGDPNHPAVYWGGWFGEATKGTSDVPETLVPKDGGYPEKKGFTTRAGHSLTFDDTDGKESITILWNSPASGDPAKTDRTKTARQNPAKSTVININKDGNFFLKTPSSYLFQIDDAKKTVSLASPKGTMITFDDEDTLTLWHKSGGIVKMDDDGIDVSASVSKGQKVNISGQNIVLNGGGVSIGGKAIDFAVLGLKLVKWLALHTHPYPFGVTLPPLPPPTPLDFLSKTVKVQD